MLKKIIYIFLLSNQIFVCDIFAQYYNLPELIPYRKGNKWGYCDKDKNIKIQPKYDFVEFFKDGLAIVYYYSIEDGYFFTVIDSTGEQITKLIKNWWKNYGCPIEIEDSSIIVLEDTSYNKDKYRLYNKSGDCFTPNDMYDSLEYCRNKYDFKKFSMSKWNISLFRVFKNNKCGLIDIRGNVIIPIQYDDIIYLHPYEQQETLEDTNYFLAKLNNKWGCIDWENNIIVPLLYDYIKTFYKDFFIVEINNKKGINLKELNIIKPIYDDIAYLGDGMLRLVSRTEKSYLYFNLNTEKKFSSLYQIYNYSEGLGMATNKENKVGFLDKEGKVVIKFIFDEVTIEPVAKERLETNISNIEEREIKRNYQRGLVYFINSSAIISLNGKMGIIDNKGKFFVSCIYDDIKIFGDNFFTIKYKGKWGLIRKDGKIIINPQYDEIYSGSKNVYLEVILNKKFGFIDTAGNEVIPNQYDIVEKSGEYSFNILNELEYFGGIIIVSKNDKFGYINNIGNLITDIKYDNVEPFNKGFALVKYNKSWFVLDPNGYEILKIDYCDRDSAPFILDNGLIELYYQDHLAYIGLNEVRYFDE